jgi:hypothetical protein
VATNHEGTQIPLNIDQTPDICPVCKKHCIPINVWSFIDMHLSFRDMQVVFRCPNKDCFSIFIARYNVNSWPPQNKTCYLKSTSVIQYSEKRAFSENIKSISEDFCNIYWESEIAENNNLLLICGVGYRKSLEILIKDYLVKNLLKDSPEKQDEVKNSFLGKCIDSYIDDHRIKESARRAVWLGNDETHYSRKWEEKDLSDLKKLLNMTVHWIDLVTDYENYKKDMPDGDVG